MLFAFGVACAAMSLFPAASDAGDPTIIRHPVYAGAEAFYGNNCPTTGTPAAGTLCSENYVIFWKGVGVEGGGSVAPPQAPWQIYAEMDQFEFDGTDGPPEVSVLRWGYEVLDGGASADGVHLATASVAAEVPMTDGSTLHFAGSWQAWSDRRVYGINGPATGLDHHYVDRCLTFVANGHQQVRLATMVGTANGTAVQAAGPGDDFAATIFNNDFQYIMVPHGGPACT